MAIPKIIHYCWFERKPYNAKIKKCMNSWHRFCFDYEIIRWDESNFPLNDNEYVMQTYEAENWRLFQTMYE